MVVFQTFSCLNMQWDEKIAIFFGFCHLVLLARLVYGASLVPFNDTG